MIERGNKNIVFVILSEYVVFCLFWEKKMD